MARSKKSKKRVVVTVKKKKDAVANTTRAKTVKNNIKGIGDLLQKKLIAVGQEVSIHWFSCVTVRARVTESQALQECLCRDKFHNTLNKFTNETHERAKKHFPQKKHTKSVHNAWDKVYFTYIAKDGLLQHVSAKALRSCERDVVKAIKTNQLRPALVPVGGD